MNRSWSWVFALGLVSCASTPRAPDKPLRDVQKASYFSGEDGLHVEAIDFADGGGAGGEGRRLTLAGRAGVWGPVLDELEGRSGD